MLEGALGQHPSTRGALQQALLEQIGLEHVLDRVLLLADRDGERREPDRAAAELARRSCRSSMRSLRSRPARSTSSISSADAATSAVILPSSLTWAKSRTRFSSRLATRGVPRERSAIATAPAGSISTSRIFAERSTICARSCGRVVLEAVRDAEAVAKRRGQQAAAGGRPDQRERGQRQGDRARAGALAEHDRQLRVLHRRVERLLDRAAQPVDLVDEEDAARLQRGEERGHVGLALQRRAGGLHQRHAELGGDDAGQRGLAQPGRAGEQHVVERLAAALRRLDEDRQLLGDLLLVDEVGQGRGRSERSRSSSPLPAARASWIRTSVPAASSASRPGAAGFAPGRAILIRSPSISGKSVMRLTSPRRRASAPRRSALRAPRSGPRRAGPRPRWARSRG